MLRYAAFAAAMMMAAPAMADDTTAPADTSVPAQEAPANEEPAATTAPADCPPLYNGITVDETVDLIRDAGYKARVEKDSDGASYIESKASGRIFDVYFYNCDDKTQRCLQLMFQIRLTTTEEQQKKALEYDIKKVFGRAYNDGDTTYMDYALHINGGVTGDYVKNNLELWDNVVGEFVQFIGW